MNNLTQHKLMKLCIPKLTYSLMHFIEYLLLLQTVRQPTLRTGKYLDALLAGTNTETAVHSVRCLACAFSTTQT